IYVFHWIVLQLFVYKYESALVRSDYSEIFSYWLVRFAGIGITLLLSYLSYHFYEKKFLALKKYFI
ncbi:MAG TPA: hypothetical protein VFC34_13835, partial [Puia sp.]|nr:hypothetical protein [Puia sp.]